MADIFGATALTGGGATALDSIDGDDLSDGDAAVVITDSGTYHYHLDATSGATENSPYVISPDTNAGTKRWLLMAPVGPFSHVFSRTDAEQSLSHNTWTTIVFEDEVYDKLSEYNTTTGVFTATYAGIYTFSVSITYDVASSWTDGDGLYFRSYVNGSTRYHYKFVPIVVTDSYRIGISMSGTVELSANDTLTLDALQNSGGARTLSDNQDSNFLCIDRIA